MADIPGIQLRQLRYFEILARERHFGRAAGVCGVSQPALSQALRQLEAGLGAPLIDRGSQGFQALTPEGEKVLDWARRTLADLDGLATNFAAGSGSLSGHLRVGAIPMAMPLIARLTTAFHKIYPGVTISVRALNFTELERALERYEIEVGVTYLDVPRRKGLVPYVLYDEEYLLLAPSGTLSPGRATVSWREAAGLPLVLLTGDMYNRQFIDGVFGRVGAVARPVVETNCPMAIFSHAKLGRLCAIVPHTYLTLVREGLGGVQVIPLVEPQVVNSMGFFIADRTPSPPMTTAFVGVAEDLIASGALVGPSP